ncbi:Phytoene dehydrogenase-related protein [Austwickia chelonae]|uniref:Pyridine nucleotide-disulfide oxidoreductase domain-containing protein 2 n=1 Tax=Austwickia chelonae NBRC 105200 TaxID=1184607 RepID=K6VMD7_9MICO|nr:NAD(P)/FAD-dependent oxidoreductase [Austwickia chelonae]GAB77909.1 putative oxidoreductase [Austwickia chelonae NBRC 105200]SEV92022.1 Phytoene dehydrogenase-related protein [Austwickia chelonae]
MSTHLPTDNRHVHAETGRTPIRRDRGADQTVDAVVIGAGHHGLVTAATLADAGWEVLVLEERPTVGGAVSSVVRDGWTVDEFSACHPLALASPVLRHLELERYGLQWARAHTQVAHLARPQEQDAPAVQRQATDTADLLARDDPRDARTWLRLAEQYDAVKEPFLEALLTVWPPVKATRRLVSAVGARHMPDFVRFMMLPSSRMGEELFHGRAARDLLAGNAMHADVPPTAPVSGVFGWLMTMLAQDVGFPSPVGGTGELARALASRARTAGARVELDSRVTRVVVRGARVHGVEVADGRRIAARRAVIADTSAQALYGRLLDPEAVPPGVRTRLANFLWDLPTVKLNYRLSGPVPWTAREARGAGVVHVGLDAPGMIRWSSQLETGALPEEPFALVGQMTSIDPSRSPVGTETLWLYTHLPRGVTEEAAVRRVVQASEQMMDRFAPDWRDLIVERWEQTPADLERADANLGGGAVGGGTQQLFQQAIWRPFTGAGGPRTHVGGLYLGSAAVHPGGGVHGACGYLAARAALADAGFRGRHLEGLRLGALHRWYAEPAPVWAGRRG